MPTSISIRALTKTFPTPGARGGGGGGITTAVDRVNLDIAPGELFFLLGPSGCGKTTLLRMIAGFIEPDAGSILFNDRDVARLPPNKRNTGMVFQSYALWPHMTVEQNVAFGLTIRKVPAKERTARVRRALETVRMADYGARKPNQLSGGQQQRIALARALVIRPDVLLLDEPLSNLDAKLRIELRSEIRRICKQAGEGGGGEQHAITTVYVTHDQKEALSMADRVAIMDRGRIAQIGTPSHLYRRPNSRFTAEFLGETNFLAATVLPSDARPSSASSSSSPLLSLSTPAGPLLAANPDRLTLAPSSPVTISIRPEAIHLSNGSAPLPTARSPLPNSLSARLLESTYLGEIAQHLVELSDRTILKVAQLNPPAAAPAPPGAPVTLSISPDDAVIIPST